jgi:hypothetical protein
MTPDNFECRNMRPHVDLLADEESLYSSCEFVSNYIRGK